MRLKATNGKYVRPITVPGGAVVLKADADQPVDETDIILESHGSLVALKQAGRYWSAQPDGTLLCDRTAAASWEMFMRSPGERGQSVAFNSASDVASVVGSYVSARLDRGNVLAMQRTDGGPHDWESFDEEHDAPAVQPFPIRGCTMFRLLQRQLAGEDIEPVILDRLDAGFTHFRVFCEKYPNTTPPWTLDPHTRADFAGDCERLVEAIAGRAILYLTVNVDTLKMMPDRQEQLRLWNGVTSRLRPYAAVVWPELVNEYNNHDWSNVIPEMFREPDGYPFWSRGSGVTDSDPATPYGPIAGYSARRDPPPSAKGMTNYDAYEFQAQWPMRPAMKFAQEGIEPSAYGFDVEYARCLGEHSRLLCGGFFHENFGKQTIVFDDRTRACARAFCGLQ